MKQDYSEVAFNIAKYYLSKGDLNNAEIYFKESLVLNYNLIESLINLGLINLANVKFREAIKYIRDAILIDSNNAYTWMVLGDLYMNINHYDDSIKCYRNSLRIEPNNIDVSLRLAEIYTANEKYDLALYYAEYKNNYTQKNEIIDGLLVWIKIRICCWDNPCERVNFLNNNTLSIPFYYLAICKNENKLLEISKSSILTKGLNLVNNHTFDMNSSDSKIINIAYFSADFHNHATSYLISQLIRNHNRKIFKVYAFSFGPITNDNTQEYIREIFDVFIDISEFSDLEVISMSRELEIHIAIDLKGFTQAARTGIFALRAAPIQVNYLGFPGTMGADFMDYIIADKIVIPESSKHYYSEKIVYLPDTYQVNDSQRHISSRIFSRAELGLPEDVFVFCCFNNNYKITPEVFDSWCRVLQEIEGSVLWLLEDNQWAKENLIKEFLNRGLSESRLIFAKRMDPADHLARHSAADLFLDTLPYNAHTTASDALWMGLPLLTQVGTTFPGRVAASLLTAIDLPELITTSQAEYENRAIELATNPELLEKIRQKLNLNKFIKPLFDTNRFTENIENAYIEMYRRYKEKLPLGSIEVSNSK